MTWESYQEAANSTAVYPKEIGITYCALKLTSEAGEVAGAIGKWLRKHNITNVNDLKYVRDREDVHEALGNIADEIGDVLWYCAQLATELGLDLDLIARANLEKLQQRKREGELKERKPKPIVIDPADVPHLSDSKICTVCHKPIYEHHTVVGTGDGTGTKFAHYNCYHSNFKTEEDVEEEVNSVYQDGYDSGYKDGVETVS